MRPLATLLSLCAVVLGCRGGEIPKSQAARVEQRVGHTEIEVEYSRPVARGRTLFGALVPYGEPWNPGANDATAISFSRDVEINGAPVSAGDYSIWMIPDTAHWTFILSSDADVFHVPYPEGKDALRLSVTPRQGSHMETLAFYFPMVDSTRAELVMHWGETIIPLQIMTR
jgi:hypothetical protein